MGISYYFKLCCWFFILPGLVFLVPLHFIFIRQEKLIYILNYFGHSKAVVSLIVYSLCLAPMYLNKMEEEI